MKHTRSVHADNPMPDSLYPGSDKRDVAAVFRERMGLLIDQRRETLSSFARSVGIDRSALSQFLAPGSTRLPRAETLHAIAGTCGVSLDWLLGLIANEEQARTKPLQCWKWSKPTTGSTARCLNAWHREATGYKIRYIPSTLPDLSAHRSCQPDEFGSFERRSDRRKGRSLPRPAQLFPAARNRHGSLPALSAARILCPGRRHLDGSLSQGPPRATATTWQTSPRKCIRPSAFSCSINGRFPSAPYTVFGPKRAAIYLGKMYLVVNSVEQIKALTRHFDDLIRIATIGPDRVSAHIRELENNSLGR